MNIHVEMQEWALQVSFGNRTKKRRSPLFLKISTMAKEQVMAAAEGRF